MKSMIDVPSKWHSSELLNKIDRKYVASCLLIIP